MIFRSHKYMAVLQCMLEKMKMFNLLLTFMNIRILCP